MEKKTKKHYEKPTLKGATVFEAAAQTCCRTSPTACSVASRNSQGKTQKNITS
jgi:hypothetical protein